MAERLPVPPGGIRPGRRQIGRPPRLTLQVAQNILAAVATGAPANWACAFVGVDVATMNLWRRQANKALQKTADRRSQTERRLVAFFAAWEQAEAAAGVRLHQAIAGAAGVGAGQRPSRRRTVSRVTPEGETVVETVEETLAADWRAAAWLASKRFPREMGDRLELTGAEGGPIQVATVDEFWAEIQRIRQERAVDDRAELEGVNPSRDNGSRD